MADKLDEQINGGFLIFYKYSLNFYIANSDLKIKSIFL